MREFVRTEARGHRHHVLTFSSETYLRCPRCERSHFGSWSTQTSARTPMKMRSEGRSMPNNRFEFVPIGAQLAGATCLCSRLNGIVRQHEYGAHQSM